MTYKKNKKAGKMLHKHNLHKHVYTAIKKYLKKKKKNDVMPLDNTVSSLVPLSIQYYEWAKQRGSPSSTIF